MSDDGFTICIVGLGLMGGSLALAWQAAGAPWHVIGVDRSTETLAAAQAGGALAAATIDLAAGVTGADVVVLATPVRTILRLLPEVGRYARPGTLVLDLGSSKVEICAALAELPAGLEPIGGHPMCGREQAGFMAADAKLYRDRPFVLCPLPRTSPDARAQAQRLIMAAGARPLLADPAAHDAAVAAISHLPYAAATALVSAVADSGTVLAWSLAASGFRDTTRVAASNVDVMLDALLTNQHAVLDGLAGLAAQLEFLRAALAAGDEVTLRAYLANAQTRRAAWHPGMNGEL
jgi:prephenate dehydrogenase